MGHRRNVKTAGESGGMFTEYEPAAPAPEPTTAPLFEAVGESTPAARDYGRAVAPVREASTGALFDTELIVGDDGALVFGIAD